MHFKKNLFIKKNDAFMYMYAILLILSHSLYVYITNDVIKNGIYIVLTIFPMLFMIKHYNKNTINKKGTTIFSIYFLVILVTILVCVSRERMFSFLCRYIIYVPSATMMFLYLKRKNEEQIIFDYVSNIIVALSCVSLLFWVFGTGLHWIKPNISAYVTWGNAYRNIYYGVYLEVPGRILQINIWRNCGIFCEAPAYCFYLGIVYLYLDIVKGEMPIVCRLVLLITILSTGTTTGLLVIFSSLFIKLIRIGKKKAKLNFRYIIFMIIVFALCFYILIKYMYNPAKMGSVMLRRQDYINGIKQWLRAPLIGHGYLKTWNQDKTGFSNSFTLLLSNCGILLIIIYVISFIGYIRFGIKNKQNKWGIWIIMIVCLLGLHVAAYSYITLTIVALGYAFLINDNMEKENAKK